jgi:hypothetical protein
MTNDPITRWTPARKVELLEELDALDSAGRASLLAAHEITPEEAETWRLRFQRFGTAGLAQHRIQELRA